MNYQKIYDDICKRGQERILPDEIYTEKHHIVPKCLGGGNEESNITVLTAREHFIVHYILAKKLYPKSRNLWYALWRMCSINDNQRNRATPSSKLYEELKIEKSFWNRGINNPMYGIRGELNSNYGKSFSEEHRNKLSISARKRSNTQQHLERWKSLNDNKTYTVEQRRKLSESSRGVNNPFYGKNHSEDSKQKIRTAFDSKDVVKGINNPNAVTIQHIESELVFCTVKLAALYFKVSCTTIQNRIKRGEFKRIRKTNDKKDSNNS